MTASQSYPAILDDLPTGHDQLDFQPYVDALSDIILDANTRTPLTLGLFGSWGSGKTSLMRMLQDKVTGASAAPEPSSPQPNGQQTPEPRPVNRAVWFNAWKYNQEDALWRALLLLLLDDLEQLVREKPAGGDGKAKKKEASAEVTGDPTPEKLVELLREALYHDTAWSERGERSINWTQALTAGAGMGLNLALSFLGPGLAAAGMATDVLTEARKEFGKGESVSQAGKLAEAFRREEIVHYQAQLRSLEQFQQNFALLVKTLLRPPGRAPGRLVVFVDDLDRCLPDKAISVLEALKLFLDVEGCVFVLALDAEAIEGAVRRRYSGEIKAREYLEKIVQVPFILPPIEAESMRQYVASMAPALPDSRCGEVFAVGLTPNPRQVKRTLNIFLLLSRLVARRPDVEGEITPVRLAKMVAIQHAHPDLYTLLRRRRESYLSDLERYFRVDRDGLRVGEGGEDQPKLPEALAEFAANPDLRRLLLSVSDEDARFDTLTSQQIRSYISFIKQATPVETPPAVHTTRMAFEPEMVTVPAGEFLMGTSDQQVKDMLKRFDWAKTHHEKGWFARERDQHPVTLPEYQIGRYPVTNAEYAEFVAAAGYAPPSHWRGARPPEELVSHPVVNVSWRDALAYVDWLRERTGQPYRLPTEAEWEKAARGQDGRLWPWGNDWDPARANCKPAGPGSTTPVGQYSPGGDSPFGGADMAGNVWEWCSSLWGNDPEKPLPYPYRADDGRENLETGGLRVLRGGSWYSSDPGIVRCAFRSWSHPASWNDNVGFRVARGPLM